MQSFFLMPSWCNLSILHKYVYVRGVLYKMPFNRVRYLSIRKGLLFEFLAYVPGNLSSHPNFLLDYFFPSSNPFCLNVTDVFGRRMVMYSFSGSVVFSPIKPVRFAIIIFADVCKRSWSCAFIPHLLLWRDIFMLHPTYIMYLLELPVSL